MSDQIEDDLSDFENLMLVKLAKMEDDILSLKSGEQDMDWDDAQSFQLELDAGTDSDEFTDDEFLPIDLRTVTWSEGKWADHSRRLLTCGPMIVTYFKFKLWEDGQFQAIAYGRNRSRHARWVFKLRIKFQQLTGPSPDMPGSHRELFWLGAKKNSDHSANETGRYEFGKTNFERMRRGELRAVIYGKCKRTG